MVHDKPQNAKGGPSGAPMASGMDGPVGNMDLPSNGLLTGSETRIAIGYTDGLIGKEIADRCGISYNTVVKHTQNIYQKAGIRHSTNALVAWFLSFNFGLDLSELRRRVEGAVLLAVFVIGLVASGDNGLAVRRAQARRIETRGYRSRRGRREDTYYIYE